MIDEVRSKCWFSQVNSDTYITFEILYCCCVLRCIGSAHGSNLVFRSDTKYWCIVGFLRNLRTSKEILNAPFAGLGLTQSSGSYTEFWQGLTQSSVKDLHRVLATSGYVHVNKKFRLKEASVRIWLFDEWISSEIEWRPLLPGKNGDWKQHPHIKSFDAAYDGGTRRLED